MSLGLRKLGLLAVLAGLVVALGVWRPGAPASDTEASLATPGGMTAMPTGGVGIPGMSNQAAPAVIRARPPGNYAVVTVFCDPLAKAPAFYGAFGDNFPLHCPDVDMPFDPADPFGLGSGAITFEISRLYPTGGEAASTFAVTGTRTLVCDDNAACDLSATQRQTQYGTLDVGIVAVQVNGGGENEIIEVRATDEIGESLSVQIVVIDTIMVFGATGPVGSASQEQPMLAAYACDDIGRQPATAETQVEYLRRVKGPLPALSMNESADADLDGVVGLDDIWDLLYGWGSTFGFGQLDNNFARDVDLPLYWCGGDTASPLDDLVTFEIDKGLLSIDPFAQSVTDASGSAAGFSILIPAFFDIDCDEGQSVSARDADALGTWAKAMAGVPPPLFTSTPPLEGECDVDFAPNGVVTYGVLGTGQEGTFTVKAQQGGGVSPPRTANGVFIGEPRISLFLDAPAVVGPEGTEFGVFVVDASFRPAAGVTVECTVDPPSAALMVVPAGGTTGSFVSATPGQTNMTLVPTGQAVVDGETLTLTCVADKDRSVIGVAVVTLSSTPVTETLDLVAGCNPIVSTWADGTDIATVAGAVAPAEALDAIWAYDPVTPAWLGFAPAAPEASDLTSADQLGPLFVCANAAATLTRPVI